MVLPPGGDVLHVGEGVLNPPLLRAQDDAVEVGIDDRRPQALELCDEPEDQVWNQPSKCSGTPINTMRNELMT